MTEQLTPGKNWQVILTLLASILGILLFAVQAFSTGVAWLLFVLDSRMSFSQSMPIGLLFWTSILGGVLLLPLLLLSINQLRGKPSLTWLDLNHPVLAKAARWVILIWPVVVLLGWLIARLENVAVILLGPINILVAGIPILWIYQAAQRGFAGGSQARKWRVFGISIVMLPFLVIVLELLAILILAGIGGIGLGFRINANPQLEQQLLGLVEQLMMLDQDLDAILDFLKPLLLQPSVIFWGLAIFGGIAPIIEEVIKPLSLWPLAGRKITPQEGFVGGLLCGAGFALMENVLYFTNVINTEDWLIMAISRAGTGVLHMLASGMMGWGLSRAWRDSKWLSLGLSALGAFVLHGFWNVLALISGVAPLLILEAEPTFAQTLLSHLPVTLMLVLAVIGLILINKHLRKEKLHPLAATESVHPERHNQGNL